jgi:hypothetical protein
MTKLVSETLRASGLLRGIATTGANGGAYNSLRFPGSRNFKSCHEPVGFPVVRAFDS